jgi:hypothetical protein
MLIDYNMSKDYCADWSAIDAIREMVQNAIDSGKEYKCEINSFTIKVTTFDADLPLNTLVLGQSVKDSNAIGKYGEGYKIGMLVLTRGRYQPTITTNGSIIEGLFSANQFDIATFKLEVTERLTEDNIEFSCLINDIDLDELVAKIPHFSDEPPKLPKKVDIWQKRPGEVFVNGLFVTKTNLVFGYNFAPSEIRLNRDRNMVDGVYWQLAQYYAGLHVTKTELIFDLIERDAPDVQDLSYHLNNKELKAELARLFFNKYGDGAKIAKPGTSYYGGHGSVSVGYTASRVYSKCGIEEAKKVADPEAPDQVLASWKEVNKSKLRRDLRESLDKVIIRSKGWKKADIF